jgi:hypothetical protein
VSPDIFGGADKQMLGRRGQGNLIEHLQCCAAPALPLAFGKVTPLDDPWYRIHVQQEALVIWVNIKVITLLTYVGLLVRLRRL